MSPVSDVGALNHLARDCMQHSSVRNRTERSAIRCHLCNKTGYLMKIFGWNFHFCNGHSKHRCLFLSNFAYCGSAFRQCSNLKNEKWIHSGEKRFNFEVCESKFWWRSFWKVIYKGTWSLHLLLHDYKLWQFIHTKASIWIVLIWIGLVTLVMVTSIINIYFYPISHIVSNFVFYLRELFCVNYVEVENAVI